MSRPATTDYGTFFQTYVSLVPEENISAAITSSLQELRLYLSVIPDDKADYAYAEGKWTVKQLLQHVIDAERVFSYRALCIGRGEQQSLPGFDENVYAANADVKHRSLRELKDEFLAVRQTSSQLFHGFTETMLNRRGISNTSPTTCLAFGFVLLGHWRHHQTVLKERYGIE